MEGDKRAVMNEQNGNQVYLVRNSASAVALTPAFSGTAVIFVIAMQKMESDWKWLVLGLYLLILLIMTIFLVRISMKTSTLSVAETGIQVGNRQYPWQKMRKLALHRNMKQIRIYVKERSGYRYYVLKDGTHLTRITGELQQWAEQKQIPFELK